MLRVECYAGHRDEETPRALVMDERRVEVVEILDRWLAPDHRYFRLKGDDGDVYLVRHDGTSDAWELTCSSEATRSRADAAGSGS
jgi:hypothetical protein